MIRTFWGSVFSGTQMENDMMDIACQNNNPHLNLHIRDSLHLKCQTCKMDCLQKLIQGTSIVLNFRVLTWEKKKEPTLNCTRNLYKIWHFVLAISLPLFALQGRIPFVTWTTIADLTFYGVHLTWLPIRCPTDLRDSSCSFPARLWVGSHHS